MTVPSNHGHCSIESKRHMAFYRTIATSQSSVFVCKPLIACLSANTSNYYPISLNWHERVGKHHPENSEKMLWKFTVYLLYSHASNLALFTGQRLGTKLLAGNPSYVQSCSECRSLLLILCIPLCNCQLLIFHSGMEELITVLISNQFTNLVLISTQLEKGPRFTLLTPKLSYSLGMRLNNIQLFLLQQIFVFYFLYFQYIPLLPADTGYSSFNSWFSSFSFSLFSFLLLSSTSLHLPPLPSSLFSSTPHSNFSRAGPVSNACSQKSVC